jgi:enolase-phosphatase E1
VSGGRAAVLLDVEGTTTPVDFVYGVLFPYARARLDDHLARGFDRPAVREDVAALGREHAQEVAAGGMPPAWDATPAAVAAYARWLMDQDRKSTGLKSLQGRIWEEGFRAGDLQGQVYADVPPALARWTAAGRTVAIFSSGSVLAQRLLFSRSNAGDLTPYLRAHFDTTTGPKRAAESYHRIAAVLGADPPRILFVSDVADELDAARAAGLETALCVREGPVPSGPRHRVVRSFDELG